MYTDTPEVKLHNDSLHFDYTQMAAMFHGGSVEVEGRCAEKMERLVYIGLRQHFLNGLEVQALVLYILAALDFGERSHVDHAFEEGFQAIESVDGLSDVGYPRAVEFHHTLGQ